MIHERLTRQDFLTMLGSTANPMFIIRALAHIALDTLACALTHLAPCRSCYISNPIAAKTIAATMPSMAKRMAPPVNGTGLPPGAPVPVAVDGGGSVALVTGVG